jgi:hypothetical protein
MQLLDQAIVLVKNKNQIILALLDRLQPGGIISPYLNPLVLAVFNYIRG